MRSKRIYILLLLLLVFTAGLKRQELFTNEKVEKSGEESGEWSEDWYPMIAQEANERRIRLRVEDRETAKGDPPVLLSPEGDFMIPEEMLSRYFFCSVHLYDGNRLVLERDGARGELLTDSGELLMGEETISLKKGPEWVDGRLYVPLEAVKRILGYESQWQAEENLLLLTGEEPGADFLPSVYDCRETGRAPRVQNQGSLGTCWAFASLMALESRLLPEQDLDFSEDHMSLRNSFGMDQNEGGEYTMSMAYLLAWQGPVLEEQDTYGDGYSPEGLSPVCHVQEIQMIPSRDLEAIKRAVYLTGGVQSSLYTSMVTDQSDSRYYNREKYAYCYLGTAKPNHDVVIVGWDDSFSRENFRMKPEGDGAFICANSWGREFGDQGYFYVSYYDANIGIHNILYSGVESRDNYGKIYQTDLCGWVGQLGYGRENAYFANIYEAGEEEALQAVGFYATGPDTSYEVFVVRGADSSAQFGRRRRVASGSFDNAGYYTVRLSEPVTLSAGERFAVIVNITTPDSIHPVAIEYDSPDKKMQVDLSDGEGYISFRGTTWERVEEEQRCNVCLKAYTDRMTEGTVEESKDER